jgi:CheY-like chemotaxis protein/HPt (histidine-containing phosphotransfer) domain-containing protein
MDPAKTQKIEGPGLGLSICKQLLDLMGGTISIESEYGLGTSFYCEIPQKVVDSTPMEKYEHRKQEDKPETHLFAAKDVCILVVDDNKVNLMVAQGILSQYKIKTEIVTSGQESIDLLKQGRTYDMILMDHMMPEMDGIETVHRIRKMHISQAKVPIVALTANAVKGVEATFLAAGMDDFLAKPIQMKELTRVLKKWLPKEKIVEIPEEDENGPDKDVLPEEKTAEEKKQVSKRALGMETHVGAGISEEAFEPKSGTVYFAGLEFLDQEEGIGYCGSMESVYESVLKTYAEAYAATIERIITYDEERDFKNLAIQVHGVKGASKNIGADVLSEMAKGLEFASKASDSEYIDGHMKEFMINYTECVRRIYDVFADDLEKEEFDQGVRKMEGSFRMAGGKENAAEEAESEEPVELAEPENMTEQMKEFDTNELAEMLAVASAGMKPVKEEETGGASGGWQEEEAGKEKAVAERAVEQKAAEKEAIEEKTMKEKADEMPGVPEEEPGDEISLEEECGRQKEKLEELLAAISYFDILTAGELAGEILKQAENKEFKKSMKKAKSALDKFNYEEAVSILKGFMGE